MSYQAKNSRNNLAVGFTIVELLIVVVVIAILAAITIVAYNGVTQRAYASAAQTGASQAMKKLATHAIDSGSYPTTLDELGILSSDTTKYQYSVNTSEPQGYCVTASSGKATYFVGENFTYTVNGGGTINQQSAVTGTCPGHNENGIPTITNFATNPGAEVDMVGYDGPNSTVLSRSSTRFRSGAASLEVTMPTATGYTTVGATVSKFSPFAGSLEPNTWYTISAWVWVPTGTVDVVLMVQGSGRQTVEDPTERRTSVKNQWVRLHNVFKTGSSGDVATRVLNGHLPASQQKFWVDDIMLVKGRLLYDYADGDTPGWDWSGTEDKSASFGPAL